MKSAKFDRWANARRNKRLRDVFLIGMGGCLFLGVVTAIDAAVTDTPVRLDRILLFGVLFIISFSFATYYHLRFMSRE